LSAAPAHADEYGNPDLPAYHTDPGAPTPDYCWFVREVPAILFDRGFVTWEDDADAGKPIPHVTAARWVWAEQWTGPGMRAAPPAGEYASSEERFAETQTFIRLNPDAAPAPVAGEQKVWLPATPKGQYEDLKRAAEGEADPNLRALLQMIRDAIRASLPAAAELDTRVFEIASEDWGIPWIAAVPGPESLDAFDRQKPGIDPAGAEEWRHLLGGSFASVDGAVQWFANAPEALPLYWAALSARDGDGRQLYTGKDTWKGAWREPWWDADPSRTADPGVPDPGFYRGRNWHPALHKWAGWVPGAITSLSNGVDLKLLYQGSAWDDAGYPLAEMRVQPGAEVEIPLEVALVVAPEASSGTPSGPYRVSPEYGTLIAESLDSWAAQGIADNLAANQTRPVKIKVKAPDQGSLVVYAAVDPRIEKVPFDCNWVNNFWAFRVTVDQPNLKVRNLTLDPNPASPGDAVTARAEIVNEGSQDVTTVARWIFEGQVVAEQEVSIPAGGYNVTQAQVQAPQEPGTYAVGVLANPNRDRPASEKTWDDNYAEGYLTVEEPCVSVGIGIDPSMPKEWREGRSVWVVGVVRYSGGAPDEVRVRVDLGGARSGSHEIVVPRGGSRQVGFELKGLPVGTHSFTLTAEPLGRPDCDPSDNSASVTVRVVSGPSGGHSGGQADLPEPGDMKVRRVNICTSPGMCPSSD
jgi:hypothetical protein